MTVDERANRDPLLGRVVNGQYEIVDLIGSGGMGSVYRAKQVGFDRFVAFKVLHDSAFADIASMRRFQAEATVLNSLSHINVVKVIVFGALEDSNRPFLVLEYLAGGSLSDCISSGAVPLESCWEIFEQIAAGVGHAHDRNVLHRDIKPGNVMFSSKPNVQEGKNLALKVVDFGVAKLMEGQTLQKLTQTGAIIGTPLYMAPEQLQGTTPTAAADVYSVGCLMYECLFGAPPFTGESLVEVATKQISEDVEVPALTASGEAAPAGLRAVLSKALEKNPDTRIQNGKELAEWLRKVRMAPDTVPPALKPQRQRKTKPTVAQSAVSPLRKTGIMIGAVVALLLIGGVLGLTAVQQKQQRYDQFEAEFAIAVREISPENKPDLTAAITSGAKHMRALYNQAEEWHDEELKQKVTDAMTTALDALRVESVGASPASDDTLWLYRVVAHSNSSGGGRSLSAYNRMVNTAACLNLVKRKKEYSDAIDEYASKAEELWAKNGASETEFDLIRGVAGLLDASDAKSQDWIKSNDPETRKRLQDERLHYIEVAAKLYELYPRTPNMDKVMFLPQWTRLAAMHYDQLTLTNKFNEAIAYTEKTLTDPRWKIPTDPIWSQRGYWRAHSRFVAQKYDEAIPLWEDLRRESNARGEHHVQEFYSYYFLAATNARAHHWKEAIKFIEDGYEFLEQHRNDPKVGIEFGQLRKDKLPDPEAILANCYEQLGQYDEAEKHISNAIALVENDPNLPPLIRQQKLKVLSSQRDRLISHRAAAEKRGFAQ